MVLFFYNISEFINIIVLLDKIRHIYNTVDCYALYLLLCTPTCTVIKFFYTLTLFKAWPMNILSLFISKKKRRQGYFSPVCWSCGVFSIFGALFCPQPITAGIFKPTTEPPSPNFSLQKRMQGVFLSFFSALQDVPTLQDSILPIPDPCGAIQTNNLTSFP